MPFAASRYNIQNVKNAGWKNRSIQELCDSQKRAEKKQSYYSPDRRRADTGSGFDRRFTVPEEPFVEEACRLNKSVESISEVRAVETG